ncbi:MAG: PepSY-associated TM helix domain-containing protein [Leeuwenhoekiella sp.]
MSKKKKYTFKKFINDVHLWLGLGSGIILFLVCLSGTILTFEEEIKGFFADEMEVTPTAETISIENLTDKLKQEGSVASVTISDAADTPYEFRVKTSPQDRRGTPYFVDQYTGKIQAAEKSSLDGFFMTMFRMHRWLLFDSSIGRPIVGIATLFFFFIAVTGVVLWWPKKFKWKSIKPGLKIKFSANWKRINHDLHNTLGFYACIFLIIMSLTGLCWSFAWYRDAGTAVLGAQIFGNRGEGPKIESTLDKNATSLSFDQLLKVVDRELNYPGKTTLNLPSGENEPINVRKINTSSWSPVIADQLVLSQGGKVLHKEIFRDKPVNVQIASLIRPIHTGQIYGTFSKIIYFLACLITTSLPITGTIIWLNKMKKKNKKQNKKASATAV